MNQNRIDKIGVAAAVDFFCRMGHIDPHIAFDDKIPVWDGSIDVHKAIDSNSKEDIEFNVYVQVKSTEHKSNNFNSSVEQTIDINDLKLYKENGGTLLIKVLFNKHKSQLYFAYLGKVTINKLLKDLQTGQKTKSIKCEKAPKDYQTLYQKLHSIHLQSNHNTISLAELNGKADWSFNITAGPMEKGTDPLEWIATNYTDILVQLPGISEQFYLDIGPAQIFTNQEINKSVTVNGIEYFPKVYLGNNSKGHIISINDFLKCQFNDFSKEEKTRIDININPSSKYVDDYLNQLRFLKAVSDNKNFYIGELRFDTPFNSITEKDKVNILSDISFFEKAVSFFNRIGLNPHFNYKELPKEEFITFEFLVKLFNGIKTKPLPNLETPYTCFKIGNYNLCFAVRRLEDGNFQLYDINACSSTRKCEDTNMEIKFPIHSFLFAHDLFPDNLNYANIVAEYKKYNISIDYLHFANFDVLSLIFQFDKTKNSRYLNSAKDIISWIIEQTNNDETKCVYRLNLLQIKSRLNEEFSEEENAFLCSISRYNSKPLNFAASVVLKEKNRAKTMFNSLSENEKCEILHFPIYNLYNELISNNNG